MKYRRPIDAEEFMEQTWDNRRMRDDKTLQPGNRKRLPFRWHFVPALV
jgi:hypothetical protein